jgi:hypothetical protein
MTLALRNSLSECSDSRARCDLIRFLDDLPASEDGSGEADIVIMIDVKEESSRM